MVEEHKCMGDDSRPRERLKMEAHMGTSQWRGDVGIPLHCDRVRGR